MPSHDPRQGGASKSDVPIVSTTDTSTDTSTDAGTATGWHGHGGHGGRGGPPLAAPTIAELADQIFIRFDTDASGTIAVSELLAVLDPDGDQADLSAMVTGKVATVDTDTDGGVSLDELTTALTALDTDSSGTLDASERPASDSDFVSLVLKGRMHFGDPVEREPLTVTDAVDNIFTVFDTDSSDIISMDELLAHLHPRGHRSDSSVSTLAEQLVALVDANGDGALSLSEVTTAVTQLDTNLDGTLDSLHGSGDIALIGVLLHAHPVDTGTVIVGAAGSLIA